MACCCTGYEVRAHCDTPTTWENVLVTSSQMEEWNLEVGDIVWCVPGSSHPGGAACGKIYEFTTAPDYEASLIVGDRTCFDCEASFCELHEACDPDEIEATVTVTGDTIDYNGPSGDREGIFTYDSQTFYLTLTASNSWTDTFTLEGTWQFNDDDGCGRPGPPDAESISTEYQLTKTCTGPGTSGTWRYRLLRKPFTLPSPEEVCGNCACSIDTDWEAYAVDIKHESTVACSTRSVTFTGTINPTLVLPSGGSDGNLDVSVTTSTT